MIVEFAANAREELLYSIEYYEQKQKGLGLIFSDQIFEAIDRIAEMPHSWTPLDDTFQRCLVKQFPFALIFTLQEKRCVMLIEQIESEALKLKATDRARLAECLLSSLDLPDEKVEQLWVAESEARYQAYKCGDVEGVPLSDYKPRLSK